MRYLAKALVHSLSWLQHEVSIVYRDRDRDQDVHPYRWIFLMTSFVSLRRARGVISSTCLH
jgi:hypothetical protein